MSRLIDVFVDASPDNASFRDFFMIIDLVLLPSSVILSWNGLSTTFLKQL